MLSAVLGFLLASIMHAVIEIAFIGLLISDFERFSLGLSWNDWVFIHTIGAGTLWIVGLVSGLYFGTYWWNIIYIKHDYPWRKKRYRWLAKYFD